MIGTPELLVGALLLLGRKKGSLPKESPATAVDDGAKLLARANQTQALDWKPFLIGQGASATQADALARWIGIESSGDAMATSSLGERGLLQLGAATVKDGAITKAEWEALISPATSHEEHARIAMKLYHWFIARAKRLVGNFPLDAPIDQAWYAKMYHQRPVDVRDEKLHGPAAPMSRELGLRWAKDPKKMHRLRAANVVAFGAAEAPQS